MEHLVISAIAPNRPVIISDVALLASKNDCNIVSSHVTLMGSEIALSMMLAGNWNNIAKMELGLTALEKEHQILIVTKRTKLELTAQDLLPYLVQIFALDRAGIVFEVVNFFALQNIHIDDLQTMTYSASITNTSVFSLTMRVGIPASSNISDLREQFILLCDELNLDGILEPDRR